MKNTKTTAIQFTDTNGFNHRVIRTGRNTAETYIRTPHNDYFVKTFDLLRFKGNFTAHNINNAVVMGAR
tara:strand:- start:793 stop:999 length:207 start_codon:yes stop_codon:yes gene_type:complete